MIYIPSKDMFYTPDLRGRRKVEKIRQYYHVITLVILVILSPGYSMLAEPGEGNDLIKEIRISGLEHTKREIVTRELSLKVGECFSWDKVDQDLKELDRLGIFSSIVIYPLETTGGLIINIELQETIPYLPVLALSINDEDGLSVVVGLKSINLFGRDIYCSATAGLGDAATYEGVFNNPWIAGNHLSFKIAYFHRDRKNEIDLFKETANELFCEFGSYVGERGRMGGRMSFQSIGSDVDGMTISEENRDDVISFGFYAGYDSRDLYSDPNSGWWNEIEIVRSDFFAEKSNFWRVNCDLRRFISIDRENVMALFSLMTLTTGKVGENIAPWQDFSIGGTNSIRGWELDSRRGKNQLISTLEYRFSLIEPRSFDYLGANIGMGMHLALFLDVGTAWSDRESFVDNFICGYGVGIRFILPYINMARIDFGFGQPGAGITVNIGSSEKPVRSRERVR